MYGDKSGQFFRSVKIDIRHGMILFTNSIQVFIDSFSFRRKRFIQFLPDPFVSIRKQEGKRRFNTGKDVKGIFTEFNSLNHVGKTKVPKKQIYGFASPKAAGVMKSRIKIKTFFCETPDCRRKLF